MKGKLVDQDLGQPACVVWADDMPPPGYRVNGSTLNAVSLLEAIRYIMEVVEPEFRETAMITSNTNTWQFDEICEAYTRLKGGEACHRKSDAIAKR